MEIRSCEWKSLNASSCHGSGTAPNTDRTHWLKSPRHASNTRSRSDSVINTTRCSNRVGKTPPFAAPYPIFCGGRLEKGGREKGDKSFQPRGTQYGTHSTARIHHPMGPWSLPGRWNRSQQQACLTGLRYYCSLIPCGSTGYTADIPTVYIMTIMRNVRYHDAGLVDCGPLLLLLCLDWLAICLITLSFQLS